jgi:hypothetical protein
MRHSSAQPEAWYFGAMTAEGLHRPMLAAFTALVAVVALGCAGSEPEVAAPTNAPAQSAPLEPWSRFAEVSSFAAANDVAFPTRGHLVKPSYAVVRVSAEAREPYLSLVTDSVLPDGALIAIFHQSRDGATKGSVYVMEKKASEWAFLALDSEGRETPENLDVCALCHRGGVADHLFGLPHSLPKPAPAE